MLATTYTISSLKDAILDSPVFVPTDNMKVSLVVNDFTKSKTVDIADLTLCSVTGMTTKTLGTGSIQAVWSTDFGQWGFILKEPAGGLNFVCTTPSDPVQTAYGWIVTNNAGTEIISCDKLPVATPIVATGQVIMLSANLFWLTPAGFEENARTVG